jgi:cytoskeletal protein CcmA (bactofilin family)
MLRMNRTSAEEKTEPDTTLDLTPRPAATYEGSMHSQTPAHSPTTTSAITESESLARDIKEGLLSGFVGNGTELTGEANFKGMLRVDGHLSGKVHSDEGTLIVSTNGLIDANVEVAVAQIQGTVNGDIIATKRIELGRVAKVTGNIQTPSLVIEQGAMFEGNCRMTQPSGEANQAAPKEKQAGTGSSA